MSLLEDHRRRGPLLLRRLLRLHRRGAPRLGGCLPRRLHPPAGLLRRDGRLALLLVLAVCRRRLNLLLRIGVNDADRLANPGLDGNRGRGLAAGRLLLRPILDRHLPHGGAHMALPHNRLAITGRLLTPILVPLRLAPLGGLAPSLRDPPLSTRRVLPSREAL